MSWVAFAIIAYVAAILQTTLVPVVFPGWFRPNVLIVVAVFYLLTGPRDESLWGAVILGAVADLTSVAPLGSQMIAFLVLALLTRRVRPIVFTDLWTTHAFAGFLGCLVVMVVYRVIAMIHPSAMVPTSGVVGTLGAAVATAVLAAIVCRVLVRSARLVRRA